MKFRPRTHTLIVEIPLNVQRMADLNYDAAQQALQLALAVSRAAVDGVICDDIQVNLHESGPAAEAGESR